MEQEAYYNREMLPQLVKWLKNEKYNWLIDFVRSHKELDFQTGSNENKQGTRRSWFSIYRGTSRILKLSCGVREQLTIEAANSYRDRKLDEKEFYTIEEWGKDGKDGEGKFKTLIENINGSEDHGKYYIKNGKKMEGYYQNLVSRRYSIYHKSDDKLLIFDKEFELGYRDEEVKKRELISTKKRVNDIRYKIMNKFINNNWMIPDELNVKKINVEEFSINTECDFVGIKKKNNNENKYELVLLEVKRRTKEDDENVYLAPLQIATYYMLLREYIKKHRENLKTVIMEMIDQKQKLGLIENVNKLDKSSIDFNKIHLAIVFGGKIDELTRKKFNIVKKIVEEKLNEEEKKEKEIKTMIDNKIKLFTCMDNGGKEEEQGTLKPLEDLNEINNEAYDLTEDSYRDNEKAWQIKLLCAEKEEQLFDGAKGGGLYDGKTYPHVLQCGKKNLFEEIRNSAIGYFSAYGIPWHKGCKGCKECEGCEVCKECKGGPTGNTLSSQIACLNHLFKIRDDKEAVLAMINGIEINENFVCVSPIPKEYDKKKNKKAEKRNNGNSENEDKKVYISFEVVSKNDLLGEGTPTRGANCTSIDALIYAIDEKDNKCLIVIEWKYTEKFTTDDKSKGDSGETRMNRYNDLIQKSKYLKPLCEAEMDEYSTAKEYKGSIYYKVTFYQLMRQTLWAEQVIKHRLSSTEEKKEPIEANKYLHLHVIPKDNDEFRRDGETEQIWKSMLIDEGKKRYITIDPADLLAPIVNDETLSKKYSSLINYLRTRYWDRPTETTNDDNQNPSAK